MLVLHKILLQYYHIDVGYSLDASLISLNAEPKLQCRCLQEYVVAFIFFTSELFAEQYNPYYNSTILFFFHLRFKSCALMSDVVIFGSITEGDIKTMRPTHFSSAFADDSEVFMYSSFFVGAHRGLPVRFLLLR